MSGFYIEPLEAKHDRKTFDCGETSLTDYLQRFAPKRAQRFVADLRRRST